MIKTITGISDQNIVECRNPCGHREVTLTNAEAHAVFVPKGPQGRLEACFLLIYQANMFAGNLSMEPR